MIVVEFGHSEMEEHFRQTELYRNRQTVSIIVWLEQGLFREH